MAAAEEGAVNLVQSVLMKEWRQNLVSFGLLTKVIYCCDIRSFYTSFGFIDVKKNNKGIL